MRLISLRFEAECATCAAALPVGAQAGYERGCGVYCPEHMPTAPDAIRALRDARAERKAAKRLEWAEARQNRADDAQRRSDTLMGRDRSPDGRADWALVTQPGHIPQRARATRLQEKAWEEQRAANAHREKALDALAPWNTRVAGDTKRRYEAANKAARARVLEWIKLGMMVEGAPYPSPMEVVRINRKTVTLRGSYGCLKVEFRDIHRIQEPHA